MKQIKNLSYIFLLFMITVSSSSCFKKMLEEGARRGGTDPNDEQFFSERTFTKEEMSYLKNSTTLFVLRKQDRGMTEEYEKAISEVWNLTDIKVINYDELPDYNDGDYSYFIIEGYTTHVSGSLNYDVPHLFLTLKYSYYEKKKSKKSKKKRRRKKKKVKKEVKSIHYCRIELFADSESMKAAAFGNDDIIDQLYRKGKIMNWSPGMMKLYLSRVQSFLKKSKREFLFESLKDKNALSKLKRKTLYIPKYVLTKINKRNGEKDGKHDVKKLFKNYPYKYKIISAKSLSEKIVEGEVQYVLDYVRSTTDNYIRIYDVKKGILIYQDYIPAAYNLKSKHIKQIMK